MDELVVTRVWMLGVVAVMAVYALIAILGGRREKQNKDGASVKHD